MTGRGKHFKPAIHAPDRPPLRPEGFMYLTPYTLLLSATIADINVTLLGLGLGCAEINPIAASFGWITLLLGKLFGTLFVVFALHRLDCRLGKLAFTPGLVVLLFVLWNTLNIAAQLWARG